MIYRRVIESHDGHFLQEGVQVLAGEIPVERLGCAHEEFLEVADALGHRLEVREIVRG